MSEQSTKKKIFLIENDNFLAGVLDERLVQEGYEVTVCKNGEKGLETLKSTGHDLLLLDIMLPGLDGMSVLKAVRKDKKIALLPVVILTNVSDSGRMKEAESLGAEYYMKSETELSEIVERIGKLIQSS